MGIHYSQIGRYEEKKATPSDDLADSSLTDKELLDQFKAIEKNAGK